METYHGHVKTPADAIILFEACRLGHLPRVQRRLSEKERQQIRSGSVFVWDEREAGMRRWTDGKSWSASRVSGSFLTYREMEGKRGGSSFSSPMQGVTQSSSNSVKEKSIDMDMGVDGPDGYRYKPDGLMKQSFSITTSRSQHLHLISYYARSDPSSSALMQPTNDPALRSIRPEKGMYPESTMHDAPAVTRSPMTASPYTTSPRNQMGSQPQNYLRHPPPIQPGYGWSPSPVDTPTTHYGQPHQSPYQHQQNGPPPPPPPPAPPTPGSANPSPMYYNRPYQPQVRQSGLTAFDRAPPPMGSGAVPPPPPPPPQTHSYYPQPPSVPPNYQQQPPSSGSSYPPPPPSYSHHLPSMTSNPSQPREGPPQYTSSPYAPVNSYGHPPNPNAINIDPRLTTPHQQHQHQQQHQQQHQPQHQQQHHPQHQQHQQQQQQTPLQMYAPPKYELPPPSPRSAVSGSQNPLRNGASAPIKTIPSIGALINPASPQMPPPPPAGLERGASFSRVNNHSMVEKATTPGPQSNGQGSLGSKMGFGEDSRLLRQLDRAFAA